MKFIDGDPITPSSIDHNVEEMWEGDQLEQLYNYLDYHFETASAYCRARTYREEPNKVALFGPFDGRHSISKVARPEFERDVLSYLGRRFTEIDRR